MHDLGAIVCDRPERDEGRFVVTSAESGEAADGERGGI